MDGIDKSYQRSYKVGKGSIIMFIIFITVFIALIGVQAYFWTTLDARVAGYISPIGGIMIGLIVMVIYQPTGSTVSASKPDDIITVTYSMMCGRSWQAQGKITQISEITMETVKSQYGILGYNIVINFKDDTSSFKYFVDKGDDAVEGI